MDELLSSLAVNITSTAICEFVKYTLSQSPNLTKKELTEKLASFLKISGAKIESEAIINFLAKNGDIEINETIVYAKGGLSIESSPKTSVTIGNDSVTKTSKSAIMYGSGAYMQAQGGAGIKQNSNGDIEIIA